MNRTEQLLHELACKENAEFPYDIQIGGYTAFNYVRRHCRIEYLKAKGGCIMDLTSSINYGKVIHSAFQSLYQVLKVLFIKPHFSNVFLAFPRLDLVGDNYCDKFSDPFIELSSVSDDYIIFENGRGGIHYLNRIHNDKIINTDIIACLSRVGAFLCSSFYYRRYQREFDELIRCSQSIYGEEVAYSKLIISKVYAGIIVSNLTKCLLKRIRAKRLFSPARPVNQFMAAKRIGIKCYEMQHGITYGETDLYSGYAEESVTPDLFLEFGNNNPKNLYGITTEKMINVGWPFTDFIKKQKSLGYFRKGDVLVISEPEVTDKMISAAIQLAEQYPNSVFYLRPHPLEEINKHQMNVINSYANIRLQDNRQNIMMVLHAFDNIIGENSTVLYEALSINKKVGKLYLSQLNPLYLKEEDRASFWEIHEAEDLKDMLDANENDKPHKCIYSPFNKELFDSLLNS